MKDNLVIGVTGYIASGKSLACSVLQDQGVLHIDADEVTHSLLNADCPEHRRVKELFPACVINDAIDRKKLGTVVFGSPDRMEALEEVLYPALLDKIKQAVEAVSGPVVIEAINLFKSRLSMLCDEIWIVDTAEDVRLSRLMTERKLSKAEALKRIAYQTEHIKFGMGENVHIIRATTRDEVVSEALRLYSKLTDSQ